MNFVLKPIDPDPREVLTRWLPVFVASVGSFERERLYLLFGSLADYVVDLPPDGDEWKGVHGALEELGNANDREIDNLLIVGLFETLPQAVLNRLRCTLQGRARDLLEQSVSGEAPTTGSP